MSSKKKRKLVQLRAIKSKISQRSWRHPEKTRHYKNVLYPIPKELKEQFKWECYNQQETMRDAIIKLLRFYVWNEGVRGEAWTPNMTKNCLLLVMCVPETTKMCFKAQCVNQMESMGFALVKLIRHYVTFHGVPDRPPEPVKFKNDQRKKDERRRTFEYARKNRVKTARSSLYRGMDSA